MKKIILALLLILLFASPVEAQVVFPNRGGTGTSTEPAYGDILVGQGDGRYGPQATSTLGISAAASLSILDEGVSLTGAVDSIDFVGSGVTATTIGSAITVTITGGGSIDGSGIAGQPAAWTDSDSLTATSSIAAVFIDSAIARVSQLASYLSLSTYFASTTPQHITGLPNLSITESQISDLGSYLTGVSWGDITGTLSNQTDLQTALDGKIAVGSTTIGSITTLPSLSITESQVSDLDHFTGADITGSESAFTGWDKNASDDYGSGDFDTDLAGKDTGDLTEGSSLYFTNERADARINATSTIGTLTSAPNLSITESQVSDLSHYTDADTAAYVNASSTIAKTSAVQTWTADQSITSSLLTITGLSDGCVEISSSQLTSTGSNCGTGSGGITSLAGLTTSSQTFATSTADANLRLTVTSSGSTHTFAPSWTGTLAVGRGGTASSSPSGFLYGPNDGSLVGTSTVAENHIDSAIARVSALEAYLTLDSYFSSTTPAHITALPSLSITESQIFDLDHFTGADITGSETAFDGWDKNASDDYADADTNAFIHASSTLPKTYTANTFSDTNAFNGALSIGSLTGVLQAIGGQVSATSTIAAAFIEDRFLRNDGSETTTGQLTATNFVASSGTATSTFSGNIEVTGNASSTDTYVGNLLHFGNGMCIGEDTGTTTPNVTIKSCSSF